MTGIRRLDEATVARIAAGEVVTRPAAVVRELVDNALDAGARRVDVSVAGDGTERIRVEDDGRGIDPADADLLFERHATSKLAGPADVDAVETLGFRGEALAAIADAASVAVTTRREGSEAVRITPDAPPEPAGRAVGTTVVVEDLFADRPARLESLASPRREFSRISDAVSRYALSRPAVGFSLSHDGDRTFGTPGSGSYVDALLGVYDRSVAGRATEFADRDGEVGVEGIAAYPSVTRANADHVYVAVDGRPVRDAGIRSAVVEGYGSLLPGDRHPVAAVDVSVPADRVDANVHPGKREVALADADRVAEAVRTAVREALSTADLARAAEASAALEGELSPLDAEAASPLADLDVIGVFRGLYVLCADGDRLLVVDGHAAHERVTYERLRAAVGDGVPSAAVDPPETLALSPRAGALVADPEVRATLDRLGFAVESLGEGVCRVRAVPAPLGRAADPGALRDVLDVVREGGDPEAAVTGDGLADLACHRSLRAGEVDAAAGRDLVSELAACEQPYACPHGRPTVLSVGEATLARGFERATTRLED
jgi:DNA mismatch repair protein MutL